MKSLLDKLTQLSQVDEEKKPDADGDGVPDWADKKPGKDDHEDKKEKKDKVDEAIAIQADGQEAMALLDMLKLAGQPAPQSPPEMMTGGCGMAEADRDPTYANSPDEMVADMDAATPSGDDMHKTKDSWRATAGGDNPMIAKMEGKLSKMFEALSKE